MFCDVRTLGSYLTSAVARDLRLELMWVLLVLGARPRIGDPRSFLILDPVLEGAGAYQGSPSANVGLVGLI